MSVEGEALREDVIRTIARHGVISRKMLLYGKVDFGRLSVLGALVKDGFIYSYWPSHKRKRMKWFEFTPRGKEYAEKLLGREIRFDGDTK